MTPAGKRVLHALNHFLGAIALFFVLFFLGVSALLGSIYTVTYIITRAIHAAWVG